MDMLHLNVAILINTWNLQSWVLDKDVRKHLTLAQSAGAVEYTDRFSAER